MPRSVLRRCVGRAPRSGPSCSALTCTAGVDRAYTALDLASSPPLSLSTSASRAFICDETTGLVLGSSSQSRTALNSIGFELAWRAFR